MMTKFKKYTILGAMILLVGATSITAFAASDDTFSEARAERLEVKKEILAEKVEAGQITQERADEIIDRMEANQAACDGTGPSGKDCGFSGELGARNGDCNGNGNGNGFGRGQGNGGLGNCGNCSIDE